MTIKLRGDRGVGRIIMGTILPLLLWGCSGVRTLTTEPEAAPPTPPVVSAATVLPTGQPAMEAITALLSDRRAKPAILGAGGLLAVILLAFGIGKVLRGESPEARAAHQGNARQA